MPSRLTESPNEESAVEQVDTPATPPETFPMGLDEYASINSLHYLWQAGLAAFAGPSDRYREEWDRLLAEFKVRPVS